MFEPSDYLHETSKSRQKITIFLRIISQILQFFSDEIGSGSPISSVACSGRFWDRATPSLMTGNEWVPEWRLPTSSFVKPSTFQEQRRGLRVGKTHRASHKRA